MNIIMHRDLDVVQMAGRKICMLGFTSNHTRILHPLDVYLYVERYTDNDAVRLTLVEVHEDGTVRDVLSDSDNTFINEDSDTLVFLARNEEDLFKIPKLVLIQRLFSQVVQEALDHKGGNESLLFVNTDTTWDSAK